MNQEYSRAIWVSLFALVAVFYQSVHAQEDATVDSILKAYVNSIGDVDALKSVRSFRTKSTLTTDSPFGELDIEITRIQLGDKYLETREIPEVGVIRTGFDGEVYWTIDPFQGAKIYQGEEIDWIKSTDEILLPELGWVDQFDGKIEQGEPEKVGDQSSHQLIFTSNSGASTARFFNDQTGELLKVAVTESLPDGTERLVELLPSDYRMVDGISVAHKRVARTSDGTFDWIVASMELNVELPEDSFELPPEIKRLLDDQ